MARDPEIVHRNGHPVSSQGLKPYRFLTLAVRLKPYPPQTILQYPVSNLAEAYGRVKKIGRPSLWSYLGR